MLKNSSKAWPIRMEDHARVLEAILRLQPKGVLVDLFFLDDPEIRGDTTIEDLIDAICEYHETSESETVSRLYLIEPDVTSNTGEAGKQSDSAPHTTGKLAEGVDNECGLNLAASAKSGAVRLVPANLSRSPTRIYPNRAPPSKCSPRTPFRATSIYSGQTAQTRSS